MGVGGGGGGGWGGGDGVTDIISRLFCRGDLLIKVLV